MFFGLAADYVLTTFSSNRSTRSPRIEVEEHDSVCGLPSPLSLTAT